MITFILILTVFNFSILGLLWNSVKLCQRLSIDNADTALAISKLVSQHDEIIREFDNTTKVLLDGQINGFTRSRAHIDIHPSQRP